MSPRLKHDAIFVAGTDTDIGKTVCSLCLMAALKKNQHRVCGMKPIASGCVQNEQGLRNEDALKLQAASSSRSDYQLVNPFAYGPPVSPNIAAAEAQRPIKIGTILVAYQELKVKADFVVIEGIGGWRTPFSLDLSSRDLVKALKIPIILVVGLKLGCINQALLTAEAIKNDGLQLFGWVANDLSGSYTSKAETIATLSSLLSVPLIAEIGKVAKDDLLGLTENFDVSKFYY